jgi:hypothetical protein
VTLVIIDVDQAIYLLHKECHLTETIVPVCFITVSLYSPKTKVPLHDAAIFMFDTAFGRWLTARVLSRDVLELEGKLRPLGNETLLS